MGPEAEQALPVIGEKEVGGGRKGEGRGRTERERDQRTAETMSQAWKGRGRMRRWVRSAR